MYQLAFSEEDLDSLSMIYLSEEIIFVLSVFCIISLYLGAIIDHSRSIDCVRPNGWIKRKEENDIFLHEFTYMYMFY